MIKAEIIKRIKALEKQIEEVELPDYIMVYYDWGSKDWIVDEKNNDSELKHFNHYKDYVIPSRYEGTVLLDLLDCPNDYIGKNLYCISMKEFRENTDSFNCGISLEAIKSSDDSCLEQSFSVIIYG